jgi:outer membrane immunogenic protein
MNAMKNDFKNDQKNVKHNEIGVFPMFSPTSSRLLAATILCALCSPVLAADMPGRRATKPVYNQVPPAFTWTGFYLGANAGTVWGDFNKGGKFINPKTGFTGGLTGGYNYQFGQYVAGVEADYNYSGLSGVGATAALPAPVKGSLTRYGTARARLGMSFDRALVYATGGYAFGFSSMHNGIAKMTDTHHGYVIGAGLEYAFTQNVSAKAEYLYMPLGAGKNIPAASQLVTVPNKTGIDASVIRAGVNYRF